MDEISKSTRFVDPLKVQPIRLTTAAIQFIAPELQPNKASPLIPLLAKTATKSSVELDTLGIPYAKQSASTAPSPKGQLYRQALETLAQPELTMTLSEIAMGHAGYTGRMLLGKERAVIAELDREGISFSVPITYSDLVRSIVRNFENTEQQAEQRAFWPSQLKVLTALFSLETGPIELQSSAQSLKARMDKAGMTPEEQKKVLAELTKNGSIEPREGGAYAMSANTAFWLTRMATGVVAEIVAVIHDAEGNSRQADTDLRFVGEPKDRATVLTLRGAELKEVVGENAPEPAGVICKVVDRAGLAELVEAVLGIER